MGPEGAAQRANGTMPVRAAEVIGAMSIATDLGTGQPLEHALRTAILAVRLGALAELSPPELGAAGEAIGMPARVLHVARDISVFLSAAGPARAAEVIATRAGGAYDPNLAALATDHLDELLDGLDDALIWDQAMAAEPPPQRLMSDEEIDAAFRVVGTFTDLKSYWLRGHAEGT